MYNLVIFVVLYCSGIDIKSADCAEVQSCYEYDQSLWVYGRFNVTLTNIWCEEQCKGIDANNRYSGTSYHVCYCRDKEISGSDVMKKNGCKSTCPGNKNELCGSIQRWQTGKPDGSPQITTHVTVSEIKLSTYMSIRESTTVDFIKMITYDTSPAIKTQSKPSTISRTASEHTNEATSSSMADTSTQATTALRPKKLLCKCPKRLINTKWHFLDGKNITDHEVRKMVVEDFNENIKSDISVDKKTVSKEVRKKNSSANKRKSSQSIGWGCIVFVILPVVFLIAIDILNCCVHFRTRHKRRKRNRISQSSNIKGQRDSSDEMKIETYQRRKGDNKHQSRYEWLQYI